MYQACIHIILYIISMAMPFRYTDDLSWRDETDAMSMSGCAAYYASGRMESTATIFGHTESPSDYQQWLQEGGYIGAVAVYRLGDKGKDVHILWPDGTIDGPYLAIDVVARNHYDLGLRRNRVIDVDYNTAVSHNMEGPVAVTIIYSDSVLFRMAYGSDNQAAIGVTTEKYKGCIGR